MATTGSYASLLGLPTIPTTLPATGGTAATISGTLPVAQVSGALAAAGGSASNLTVSGTLAGAVVRSGTTTGGVLVSPTITTPTGITASDVGALSGTGGTITGNVTGNGTSWELPNQVAANSARIVTKGLADGLYMPVGKVLTAARTSGLTITNNTTLADDAFLTFASVPVGTYKVEIFLQEYNNDGTTGGFKWALASSGTISAGSQVIVMYYGTIVGVAGISSLVSGESIAPWGNATYLRQYVGTISVTSPGDLRFQWAQAVSGTGFTRLNYGYMIVTKLN